MSDKGLVRLYKLLKKTNNLIKSRNRRSIKQMTAHAAQNAGKVEHLFIADGNANWCSHYGNQCDSFRRKL